MLSSSEVGFAASSFHATVRFPSQICTWGALQQLPQFSPLSPVLSDSAHQWSLPCPHHGILLTAARYLLTVVACCPVLAAVLCQSLDSLPSPSFPLPDRSLLFLEAPSWPSSSSCISCPQSFPLTASVSSAVHCLFVLSVCLT